jgi:hypothetical protein
METFVVRLWTPSDHYPAGEPGLLCGTALHVATASEARFIGATELLAFLLEHSGRHNVPATHP